MKKMLINAIHPEEVRVAIVEDATLIGLYVETSLKEQLRGNIYKGKITRIEHSLNAVFVDFGRERNGFLPVGDINPAFLPVELQAGADVMSVLQKGMEIPVQVAREEKNRKGALLTTNISLPGRYMVLVPNQRLAGISRKIEDEEQRQRLKEIIRELDIPEGHGIIVRTAGLGKTKAALQRDLSYLQRLWKTIQNDLKTHEAPGIIYHEGNIIIRTIRDYYTNDITEILIDDEAAYKKVGTFLQRAMPRRRKRLKLYKDSKPIFAKYELERQIESIYNRDVRLNSGGSIVIEQTEALVSIDVNSGQATTKNGIEDTAFSTNMEAAVEIARQLILRDLGGLIVVDFIDMRSRDHNREVEKALREELKSDRAHLIVGKISQFGLLELSRERLSPPLIEKSHVACHHCDGTGLLRSVESAIFMALREIQLHVIRNKNRINRLSVDLHAEVALAMLNQQRDFLADLEHRFGIRIFINVADHLNPGDILIHNS